jgi:putative membrane protein insertion efficiency factor
MMIPVESGSQILQRLATVPRILARALVKLYRFGIAPLLGMNCRHLPSCSVYADEALARYGLWAGGWMTLARLLRCHPWGTHGLDFVPQELPKRAHWYLPWRYGRWRGTNADVTAASRGTRASEPHAH